MPLSQWSLEFLKYTVEAPLSLFAIAGGKEAFFFFSLPYEFVIIFRNP